MNKEFEKMIEKLEEYKHENLVEHDYEQLQHCKDIGDCGIRDCVLCVFNKAIEIVKQEAEKYNNGWILVSEKLPEDYETYLVTNVDSFGQRHTYKGWYGVEHKIWHMEGNSERKMNVIAWQPLPQPYQPKGE